MIKRKVFAVLAAVMLLFGGAAVIAPAANAMPVVCKDNAGNWWSYDSNRNAFRIWVHRQFYGYYSCLNGY